MVKYENSICRDVEISNYFGQYNIIIIDRTDDQSSKSSYTVISQSVINTIDPFQVFPVRQKD